MKRKHRVNFIIILMLCLPTNALSDDSAVKKYYGYLPSQITALPEAERRSKVPMIYTGAANLFNSPAGELTIQMSLNILMYSGMTDLDGAIREFQKDLGDDPTGILTVGQIYELGYRSSRVQLSEVGFFPLGYQSWISDQVASIQGTAEIIGEKIAYPINHVRVECFKEGMYCEYHQLFLSIPDRNSFAQIFSVLDSPKEIYRITRWENNQIDALPSGKGGCRTNQLSFNFTTKEFIEITRNNTTEDCKVGTASLPRLTQPRISRIVDGEPIFRGVFDGIQKESFEYFSGTFRVKVKALENSMQ